MSALPFFLQWVSPRYHHPWQLFIQPAVKDGCCWRLRHSPDSLFQDFTIGKFLQVSELKPSWCNSTTIFSVFFTMDREIRIVSSLKAPFMFFEDGLKRPSVLNLSSQAVLSRPATILAAVIWLYPVELSMTCLWLMDIFSSTPRAIQLGTQDAERTLH